MLPHYNNQLPATRRPAPPHQMQPQLGINNNNNQLPIRFMNVQNHHLGMPQYGSVAPTSSQPGQQQQPPHHVGFFGSQNNAPPGMNSVASFPLQGQFCNLVQNLNQVLSSQPPAQLFAQNMLNLAQQQQMNQNMGLPYGQFCFPNPLQNMNQFVPMQMQNPSQCGGPNYAFPGSNQVPLATISQHAPVFANQQFGNVHSNQGGPPQVNQNQQNLVPPPMQGTQPQGHTNTSDVFNSNSNWKQSPSKNFTKHPKRGVQPQGGFQNSQFHQRKNAKGNFAFPNRQKGKGSRNESEGKFTNHQGGERKRSLSLSYTEQEIRRWREERKKHYPSQSNIEKKLSEKLINSEIIEREAKTRREQLKEILAKQAELGVEVAEIPPCYLADSNPGHGRGENGSLTERGRFPNKFGKREKYDKKDRFAKRQRSHHKGQRSHQKDSSTEPSFNKREPTLLQKLLSADIRRDRSRLLQVFRFMVTNSFFKDCPDKPLKFPTVAVKESGCEEDVTEELSSLAEKDMPKGSDMSKVERVYDKNSEDNNYVVTGDEDDDEEEAIAVHEEEEGEIIN